MKISFGHICKMYTRTRIKSRKYEDANIILKSLTAGQNGSSFSFSCHDLVFCPVIFRYGSSSALYFLFSCFCGLSLASHLLLCVLGFGTFDLIGHQLIKNSLFLYNLPQCVSQPLTSTPRVHSQREPVSSCYVNGGC